MVEEKSQSNEDFIKSCNDDSDKYGDFLDVDVQYLKNLHSFPNDLLFLSEIMKI